jgi:hypothetical protein
MALLFSFCYVFLHKMHRLTHTIIQKLCVHMFPVWEYSLEFEKNVLWEFNLGLYQSNKLLLYI